MDKIENLQQYEEAAKRVEELLPLVNDNTPTDDPNYIELVRLSNMVADYSDEHFSILKDFDEVLDARHGKVGTPEREQFRKEADEYCLKITTAELFEEADANVPKEVQLETD